MDPVSMIINGGFRREKCEETTSTGWAPHKIVIGHFLWSRDQRRGEGKSGPSMEPSEHSSAITSISLLDVHLFTAQKTFSSAFSPTSRNCVQNLMAKSRNFCEIDQGCRCFTMSVDTKLCKMRGRLGCLWQLRIVNKLVNGQWFCGPIGPRCYQIP